MSAMLLLSSADVERLLTPEACIGARRSSAGSPSATCPRWASSACMRPREAFTSRRGSSTRTPRTSRRRSTRTFRRTNLGLWNKIHLKRGVFVGVAISGGGSRAANFGAAMLEELDALGLLDQATAISGVSGGSLPAAYYSLHWKEWRVGVDEALVVLELHKEDFVQEIGERQYEEESDDRGRQGLTGPGMGCRIDGLHPDSPPLTVACLTKPTRYHHLVLDE
jgi:hypothetical protein